MREIGLLTAITMGLCLATDVGMLPALFVAFPRLSEPRARLRLREAERTLCGAMARRLLERGFWNQSLRVHRSELERECDLRRDEECGDRDRATSLLWGQLFLEIVDEQIVFR